MFPRQGRGQMRPRNARIKGSPQPRKSEAPGWSLGLVLSPGSPCAAQRSSTHALPGLSTHNAGLLQSHWGYFLGNVSFIQNSVFRAYSPLR